MHHILNQSTLELVKVPIQRRNFLWKSFPLSDGEDKVTGQSLLVRVIRDNLPVVKHTLWESLTRRAASQVGCESERFRYRQVAPNVKHWCSRSLQLLKDLASSLVHDGVDTSNGRLRALNVDQEDRLHQSRLGRELGGIEGPSSRWDNLGASSVHGVGMERYFHNVVPDSTHAFGTQDTFLSSPLESRNHRILDFAHVLLSFGSVHKDVGSFGQGSK
mmetsp:Transcript_14751/g.20554  ORF Transcript_14751/g.20554 Transcript_14751/m.20554 type:complete len:217 (+) Transcript_14751:115-765(+)